VVDVRSGATSEVRFALVPATVRELEFRVPPGDPSISVMVRVTSSDGTREYAAWHPYSWRKGDLLRCEVQGLLRGNYRLEARSGSGRTVSTWFEVDDLEHSETLRSAL